MSDSPFMMFRSALAGVQAVAAHSRQSFGRHMHDQFGIGVIRIGAQVSHSGRGRVEAGPGHVITVNPGEIHDGAPIGDGARAWLMLYLDPDVVAQAAAELGLEGDAGHARSYEFEHPASDHPALARDVLALAAHVTMGAALGGTTGAASDTAIDAASTIAMDAQSRTAIGMASAAASSAPSISPRTASHLSPLACDTLLLRILAQGRSPDLRRLTSAGSPAGSPADRGAHAAPNAIRHARSLIDDDPAALISLADLATASGLSRYQVLRAFSRATGMTPHAYQMQRRLLRARQLIRQGLPLVQAAMASGFADQSHMTRLFVRTYGVSPQRYALAAGPA